MFTKLKLINHKVKEVTQSNTQKIFTNILKQNRMKKSILLLLFLLSAEYTFSQIANIISSSSSIAQTSVADSRSWAAFHNPAAFGNYTQHEFAFLYENRFFIKELSNKSAQAVIATDLVNVGVSFSHFGYSIYHEMMAGVGLARNFSDKFNIGVQFNYYTTYFAADNQYRGALLGQIGLSFQLSPKLNLGFNTFNPFQTNIKTEYVTKRLPSVYSLGTEYFFAENLRWHTQVDKEISSNYRFATGFDYRLADQFAVKLGGYASKYFVPCLGFGMDLSSFTFDLNCELHPILGLNTLGMIRYKF